MRRSLRVRRCPRRPKCDKSGENSRFHLFSTFRGCKKAPKCGMIKARSDKAIKSEVENGSDTYRAVHRPQKKIKKPDAGRA